MKQRITIDKSIPNTGIWDFSHLLDAPAGKHGFVTSRDGHLFFEDGTRARFLGFNISARGATPTHETAEKLAERFASMGVNIMRLHAADAPIGDEPCSWSQTREAPLIDYESGSSRRLHPEGLDRFDYFVAKLRERGIYLHIDLMQAREFLPGDGLDYPGGYPSCQKGPTIVNERLAQLQMEYAKALLTHVNPYTGLALVDDPAVVTVQMTNEDSAIKSTVEAAGNPAIAQYRTEIQRKFNHFLLAKYDTRANLAAAWTHEGVCALGEDEDPAQGTVRIVEGSFVQPVNDLHGEWAGSGWTPSPARYADFMEFGIQTNRRFYQRFKRYLISLGVRVPIAASNLLGGAADVYGHTDGDIMENNAYFNHPLIPWQGTTFTVAGPNEYVSVNPLTLQTGVGAMATTILSLASEAAVDGKPFMVTEWNEYGLHPFHSTAFVQTVAYACLNDWDGLILYNYQTSENWFDQPADTILNVFDAYNDPAVICQWGFMATVFLKGLVHTARNRVDVVYTQEDLRTLPNFHAMPNCFLPYITCMRNVFLDGGSRYQGHADAAVNAGFLNGADLSEARHGVWYAWSRHLDAFRRCPNDRRLPLAARDTEEVAPGVHLGEKALVFDDIAQVSGAGNYTAFAAHVTAAFRRWKLLNEGTGLAYRKLVSDTGEICFDPDHSRFSIQAEACAYFSGAPEEEIHLGETITVRARNERISLSALAADGKALRDARSILLTALGTTGCEDTTMSEGPAMMGFTFTNVTLQGKLFAETLEGTLSVRAQRATLEILSPIGEVLASLPGVPDGDTVRFDLDGSVPGVQYHLTLA